MKLVNYNTGEYIRAATEAELRESVENSHCDGGVGVMTVPDYDGPVFIARKKEARYKAEGCEIVSDDGTRDRVVCGCGYLDSDAKSAAWHKMTRDCSSRAGKKRLAALGLSKAWNEMEENS